jgi:hypothetical protein
MSALTASSTLNSNRDPKKAPDPIDLPMPWPAKQSKSADVTPEERSALRAELLKRSAFASAE